LITVCANCHRMLHRMNGVPTDIPKLRRMVNKQRGFAAPALKLAVTGIEGAARG
jgi:hypothetical protein